MQCHPGGHDYILKRCHTPFPSLAAHACAGLPRPRVFTPNSAKVKRGATRGAECNSVQDAGGTMTWSNYSDLSRGHPKWWLNRGIHPKMPLMKV